MTIQARPNPASEILPELRFPNGIELLHQWQMGDVGARDRLKSILDDTVAGRYDWVFSIPAPSDQVHACGPVDLLTLTIMYRLYGLTTEVFYKHDAERFIRSSLMVQRLMGMQKQYISWPVYGFTAEALGQPMIYSDQYSPGTDPDDLLFNHNNFNDVTTPDFTSGIPKLLDQYVDCYHRLTGLQPVLHLTAAYSLAADTFGQEAIIHTLTHQPDFANAFLDLLVDRVLQPWADHFFKRYPQGWLELSDASGSPFFIGPDNCKNMAIRSSQRLKDNNVWGDRVYDANYRGDYVTQADKSNRGTSRRRSKRSESSVSMSLDELFEVKNSVCPDYVIRLAEDRIPLDFYEQQAIRTQKPLFIGIGATQVDRNSIADFAIQKHETELFARQYVESIKRVAISIASNGFDSRALPWPGAVYFEDVSAESSFELIQTIIGATLEHGNFTTA